MRLLAKPLAILLCVLSIVTPCMADIIPNEAPARAQDVSSADAVKAKLARLGVAPSESATIVAKLSNEDLQFLARYDKANVAVGQDDLVVMFWYEWIFAALAIGMGVWAWQEWGEDAFFKD
jgi:hypothetical protein